MLQSSPTPSTPPDAALIAASLADPALFSTVFDRHFAAIYAYLARRAGAERAEDLSSQTFCVAFERRGAFDTHTADARPWLYGIATNLLRNELRERHRAAALVERMAFSDRHVADGAGAPLALDRVGGALVGLDEDQREALLLLAWGELSYAEIAVALDVPVGTIRSRIARARERMRAQLGVDDPEGEGTTINEEAT